MGYCHTRKAVKAGRHGVDAGELAAGYYCIFFNERLDLARGETRQVATADYLNNRPKS